MALIDDLVAERGASWVETRRDIHRNPELGFTELRTAAQVATRLSGLGFAVRVGAEVMSQDDMRGVPDEAVIAARAEALAGDNVAAPWLERMPDGQTGVVAEIRRGDGPVTAYRFDMDALPLAEAGEAGHKPVDEDYVSRHANIHHACGHDGHTAIGLGFAEWLAHPDAKWSGTARLVFQPAEEGGRGAHPMAEAGVVDDADWLFAAHLGCGLPSRQVAAASAGMLNSTKLDAVFSGVPAHAGANPEDGNNALLAAATATLNLHAISRVSGGSTRVNVGRVTGGTARNIVAKDCWFSTDVRVLPGESSKDWLAKYQAKVDEVVKGKSKEIPTASVRLEAIAHVSGVSTWTKRPSFMIAIWVPSLIASAKSWVMKISVFCNCCCNSMSSSCIPPPVGLTRVGRRTRRW